MRGEANESRSRDPPAQEKRATAEGFMDENPLGLDPDTMQRVGYQTVDMLVDMLSAEEDGPPRRLATRPEMERRLGEPPPEEPRGFDEILDRLERDVPPFVDRTGHPRYFAFISGNGT